MYLVELMSGKEAIYRTADEFGDAIRRGDVTAQSRIYHRAASTWISVTFHPQFRKVSAEQAEQSDQFAQPLPLRDWTFLRTDLNAPSSAGEVAAPGETAPHEGAPERAAPQSEAGAENAAPALQARSWRKMLSKLVRQD
jgi:hypothetical protein